MAQLMELILKSVDVLNLYILAFCLLSGCVPSSAFTNPANALLMV